VVLAGTSDAPAVLYLLSANDAIQDDARGHATRAAAAVLGFEARRRPDVGTAGRWHDLLDEGRRVARIAADVREVVQRAEKHREALVASLSHGLLKYALNSYAEEATVLGIYASKVLPIADAAEANPSNLPKVLAVVEEILREAARDLANRPWRHNSTGALSNVANLWEADAIANVLGHCERVLGYNR
jgi:hypothetical protein